MHISDGVLPVKIVVGAGVAAVGLGAVLLARLNADKIPRVALCASFFFVASLVHVPIGPTSAHLLLIGLVGIGMGTAAFLPILFGLVLQALLFQHGGITTVGVNALTMGLPAYAAYGLFRTTGRLDFKGNAFAFAFLAGAVAVILAGLLTAGFLVLADQAFIATAWAVLLAHLPVAVVEGIVTGFAVVFLSKVRPGILEAGHA